MKIAALVSGGVDSSVALALLKEAGHDVTAFYLKIWLEDEVQHLGDCAWETDLEYVEATCKKFDVPLQVISMQREYWDTVVAETIAEVKAGRTPNPDIWCNEKVKFGSFYSKIPDEFEKVATGHYAQVEEKVSKLPSCQVAKSEKNEEREACQGESISKTDPTPIQNCRDAIHRVQSEGKTTAKNMDDSLLIRGARGGSEFYLKTAPDPIKDQTYFLSRLSQKQLGRAMFPIGHLPKSEVRALAEKFDLPTKNRPDSQGICFLGKFKFSDFLREHLGEKKGNIVEKETGKKVGEHNGFWFYTLGQRQGLGLSGGPWFVVGKDLEKNKIIVSTNAPIDSGTKEFTIENCNFIPCIPENGEYDIKLRHGERFIKGELIILPPDKGGLRGGSAKIILEKPDRGIAPGQSAVLYKNGYCLGGGIISF